MNAVCPFCGDRRGKMTLCISKGNDMANVYQCFHCGEKGNMLTLYADLKGIYGTDRYKTAYREILEAVHTGQPLPYQKKIQTSTCEKETADPEQRDAVYRRMLDFLSLTDAHYEELMRRGLTAEQIEAYGFRSTQVQETEGLARKLLREGYRLKGIPGFFVNERKNWDIAFFSRNYGFLCPAYSLEGKISGFQIRLDQPYDGRKYIWLSSANRNHGCSSKSPVIFLGNPRDKTIRVTEGILKATVAHGISGFSFLGVPGVSNYKSLEQTLRRLRENGLRMVYEMYDMDKCMDIECHGDDKETVCRNCRENCQFLEGRVCRKKAVKREHIRDGCRRLYRICKELGLSCERRTWDMGENGVWLGKHKGIDDFWLAERQERMDDVQFVRTADIGKHLLLHGTGN